VFKKFSKFEKTKFFRTLKKVRTQPKNNIFQLGLVEGRVRALEVEVRRLGVLLPQVELQLQQRQSTAIDTAMKTIREEMNQQRANMTCSLQKIVGFETSKAMKKHKDDILIELRRGQVIELEETPETGGDSSVEAVTARSRHASGASIINISCDTRDDLAVDQ
jgi:hypothetical protein